MKKRNTPFELALLMMYGGGLVIPHQVSAQQEPAAEVAADTVEQQAVAPIQSSESAPADEASAPPESIPVASTEATVAAPEEAQEGATNRLVEEIIVTAQKREENVQDVPISISAFSADQLDARGLSDPKDLPLATPGLTLASQAGFNITYLRGVGTDAFLLADPSVALYIDGVYFPFSAGQAQNLGAVERVEVLKGPQGTLFGRNAVGGAINVVTKSPDLSEVGGSIQTSYSRFDNSQTRIHANIPLSETFAMSASVVYGKEDDYRDGTTAGNPLPGEVTRGARVKVRWAPSDHFDFTLAGYRMQQQGVGTLFAPNTDPSPIIGGGIPAQSADSGATDVAEFSEFNDRVIYGQAVVYTDWFDIKVLGSGQKVIQVPQLDFDGSPMPLVSFTSEFFGNIKTAELQLVSNDTSWGSDRFKWIVGYYHFDGYQGIRNDDFSVGGTLIGGINDVLNPARDSLALLGITLPQLLTGDIIRANGSLQNDSNSIYAQASYKVTDWMGVTLGLRAQDEKRTIVESSGSAIPLSGPPVTYVAYSGQSDTTRSLQPKVSLDFHPWEDGLIYASYQEAVKSSTYNVVNFLRFTEPEVVKKEELTAYEVGLKTALFDNSTTLSTAAFYYKIENLQVQFVSLLSGGAVTFESAPEAEVKGVEFEFLSQLFPSVLDGTVLSLSGAYVDAKFTDYEGGQGFDSETRIYSDNLDLTGERIPRTPKYSGTAAIIQTFSIPGGDLEMGVDYYYNSGFYYLAQSDSFTEEKAYGLMGARVSYLYDPWSLRVTVFGKNLLDETYNNSRFVTDFGTLDAQAPPTLYGVRLNWEF